ncbi:uncharacterized protein LOC108047357 [Drosophila rhopaloa]|uniref:Chitin-binding type-2 domain-containing protein n=1 Tax=Drosophila rhopaloa TaxID=1041015 RepID=A0ABM5HNK8_DRORH|nr:uncharacterized protein LOC108047357 [Drosophila rhopaloa]
MRSSLPIYILLLGLALGTTKADDNPCQDVGLAGFVCLNCTTLGYCIRDGTGKWETKSMLDCQSEHNFFCSDEGTFGCTWQSQCKVPKRGPFHCQQEGSFPDPYDCRRYHKCSDQSVDSPHICSNGAGYSTLTDSCVLPRESEQCTEEQFSCSRSGQVGGWTADNRYFYVCIDDTESSLYPVMMKCREGYVFNGYSCVPESALKNLDGSLQEEESSKCVDKTRYECPFRTSEIQYCKCVDGEQQVITCPSGFHFDTRIMTCVSERIHQCKDFEVLNCPNVIAKNEYCICIEQQLQIYDCPKGHYFNAENLLCQEE